MEPVEVQLARLTAMFEASRQIDAARHNENVIRLVRIEAKQDVTNGRVTKLETQQAVDDAASADEGRKPITKRDWIVMSGTVGVGYAVLKALGVL
jgi:hypothetical protein